MDGSGIDHLARTFGAIGAGRQARRWLRPEAIVAANFLTPDDDAVSLPEIASVAHDQFAESLHCGWDTSPLRVSGLITSRLEVPHGR